MIEVVAGKVYRGPRPSSVADVPGIKTLLDLEPTHDDSLGLDEVRLPLSAIFPPRRWQLGQACAILLQPDLWPVCVHCKCGVDRTGMVIAAYRYHIQSWPMDRAVQEMLDCGFHRWRYLHWLVQCPWILR